MHKAPPRKKRHKKGGCIAIVKKPLVIQPHFAVDNALKSAGLPNQSREPERLLRSVYRSVLR